MKLAFMDIGELGWSMYVAAHVRWYKEKTDNSVAVMTYPDRRCLYEGLADVVIDLPEPFYTTFDMRRQNCLGIQKIMPGVLKNFLSAYLIDDYRVPDYFIMRCKPQFGDKLIFRPYKYSKKIEGLSEILIFPRHRTGGWYSFRNLPKEFYVQLIDRLCVEFPDFLLRTIGTANAAYDINIGRSNYVNWIGKSRSLQEMIDRCQTAVAAVGSQSGPPKIALLQGVPTFMIGHQRHRHMVNENWSKTRVEFVEIKNNNYSNFDKEECINRIVSFIRVAEKGVSE